MSIFIGRRFTISVKQYFGVQNIHFSSQKRISLNSFQVSKHKLSVVNLSRCFSQKIERPNRPKTRMMVLTELITPDEVSTLEWSKIKSTTLKECRDVDSVNVDAVIIDYLLTNLDLSTTRSFVEFLLHSGCTINRGAIGKILRFYYLCGSQNVLTKENKAHIIKIYYELIEQSSTLDPTMCEYCIHALSYTTEWKEGLKLLKDIKLLTIPTKSAYAVLISAAFVNNEKEIGWQLFEEVFESDVIPPSLSYLSWIDYCVKKYKSNSNNLLKGLERIFDYCRDTDVNIEITTAKGLENVFTNLLNWRASHVSFSKSGKCPNCQETLQKISISLDEQKELREVLHRNVIIGNNKFAKTSPEEMNKFLTFLESNGPFDYVVDGLNVAYTIPYSSEKTRANLLAQMIKSLQKDNKRILVIGRSHMLRWNAFNINYIKSHASLFLTTNVSYDDPFLLYAALSYPGTKFISRDLMRGHRFLMNNTKLRNTFKRWQQGHQLSLKYATDSGAMCFYKPVKHLSIPQKNGESWHIPYNLKEVMPESLDLIENWLCLQPPI